MRTARCSNSTCLLTCDRYFADRDVFCAGRVSSDDLERVVQACGGSISSTCSDIQPQHLGTCERFDERQIGGERFNFFEGCPAAKTCTLVLRGGAEQFIAEVERSLHDAIMIVKRAIRNSSIVAGGGACEVRTVHQLHQNSLMIEHRWKSLRSYTGTLTRIFRINNKP